MHYKNKEVQPEFFSGIKKLKQNNSFQKGIFADKFKNGIHLAYDALVVVIISVLMTNLTFYVLGIERGKSLAGLAKETTQQKSKMRVETSREAEKISVITEQPQSDIQQTKQPVEEQKEETTAEIDYDNVARGYAIQLVTYSSNSYADKEMDKLKTQGFRSFTVRQGNYYVVFSGVYPDKQQANKQLKPLQNRYKDCFVRRFDKS
ncbi:MAG: SPOR domain-containing protein [Candidatus Omnitrophica bacterium]|nr:SPOR domain-containing protein [Candidatus Omnitrophota bacterium]